MRILTGALERWSHQRHHGALPCLPSSSPRQRQTFGRGRRSTAQRGDETLALACTAPLLWIITSSHQSVSQPVTPASQSPMLESGMALHRGRSSAALITNLAPGASRASRASVQGVACLQASTNGGCQVHQVDAAAWQRRAPTAIRLDASPTPTP